MNKIVNTTIISGLIVIVCLVLVIIIDPFGWRNDDYSNAIADVSNPHLYYNGNSGLSSQNKSLTSYDKLLIEAFNLIDNKKYYDALNMLADADGYVVSDLEKNDKLKSLYNKTLINLAKYDQEEGIKRDYSLLLLENRRAMRDGKIVDDIDRLINSAIFRANALYQYENALNQLFIADLMLPNAEQKKLIESLYEAITNQLKEKDEKESIKRVYLPLNQRREDAKKGFYLSGLDLIKNDIKSEKDDNKNINEDKELALVSEDKANTSEKSNNSIKNENNVKQNSKNTDSKVNNNKTNSKTTNEKNSNTKNNSTNKNISVDNSVSNKEKNTTTKNNNEIIKTESSNEDSLITKINPKKLSDKALSKKINETLNNSLFEEAKIYLKEYLNRHNNDYKSLLRLAGLYQKTDDYKTALSYAKKAYKINSTDPTIIKLLADLYFESDLKEIAYEYYAKYIDLRVNDFETIYKIGLIDLESGNYKKAENHFLNILNYKIGLDRKLLRDTLHNLGRVYELQHQVLKALGYYNEALKWDSDYIYSMIQMGKIYYNQGVNSIRTDQFSKAKEILTRAIKLEPENYEVLIYLGKTEEKLKNIFRAIELYSKAMNLSKKKDTAKSLLKNAVDSLGNINEVIMEYEDLNIDIENEDVKDDSKVIINYISTDDNKNKPEENNDYHYYLDSAEALRLAKKYDESEKEYNKALELGASEKEVYLGLAKLYFDKGEYKKSIKYNNDLISKYGVQSEYLLNIAVSYNIMGDFNSAIKYYKKCISLEPSDFTIKEELAKLYYLILKYSECIELLEAAIQQNKKINPETYQLLGEVYIKVNKINEAIDIFNKIISNYPDYYNIDQVTNQLNKLLG